MTPLAITGAVLGLTRHVAVLVRVAGTGALAMFVMASLSLLYRYQAGVRRGERPRGPLLWLIGSTLFSVYVGHLPRYDAMYGSLGAVAGVIMWFYVTVYVALPGAELNAELE